MVTIYHCEVNFHCNSGLIFGLKCLSYLDRLYKEALKQAAVDPSTGKIDITILTTGISGAARKRKAEITQSLKKLIKEKGKVPTLKQPKLLEEFKERSDFVSSS